MGEVVYSAKNSKKWFLPLAIGLFLLLLGAGGYLYYLQRQKVVTQQEASLTECYSDFSKKKYKVGAVVKGGGGTCYKCVLKPGARYATWEQVDYSQCMTEGTDCSCEEWGGCGKNCKFNGLSDDKVPEGKMAQCWPGQNATFITPLPACFDECAKGCENVGKDACPEGYKWVDSKLVSGNEAFCTGADSKRIKVVGNCGTCKNPVGCSVCCVKVKASPTPVPAPECVKLDSTKEDEKVYSFKCYVNTESEQCKFVVDSKEYVQNSSATGNNSRVCSLRYGFKEDGQHTVTCYAVDTDTNKQVTSTDCKSTITIKGPTPTPTASPTPTPTPTATPTPTPTPVPGEPNIKKEYNGACTSEGDHVATYIVTVDYAEDPNADLADIDFDRLEDVYDQDVQASWIRDITPAGTVETADHKIVWGSFTLSEGDSKVFTYKIVYPKANLGETYTNVATIYYGSDQKSAHLSIVPRCDGPTPTTTIPDTGVFDADGIVFMTVTILITLAILDRYYNIIGSVVALKNLDFRGTLSE